MSKLIYFPFYSFRYRPPPSPINLGDWSECCCTLYTVHLYSQYTALWQLMSPKCTLLGFRLKQTTTTTTRQHNTALYLHRLHCTALNAQNILNRFHRERLFLGTTRSHWATHNLHPVFSYVYLSLQQSQQYSLLTKINITCSNWHKGKRWWKKKENLTKKRRRKRSRKRSRQLLVKTAINKTRKKKAKEVDLQLQYQHTVAIRVSLVSRQAGHNLHIAGRGGGKGEGKPDAGEKSCQRSKELLTGATHNSKKLTDKLVRTLNRPLLLLLLLLLLHPFLLVFLHTLYILFGTLSLPCSLKHRWHH